MKTSVIKYSSKEIYLKLTDKLISLIKRNKPDYVFRGRNYRKRWANEARLMIYVDKRNPATIEKVMEWALSDPFWKQNIWSMKKFRLQFDRLEMQYNNPVPHYMSAEEQRIKEEGDLVVSNLKAVEKRTKERIARLKKEGIL